MPRTLEFLVVVEVRDDDETEPTDMAGFIATVLNAGWDEAAMFTVHGPSTYREE